MDGMQLDGNVDHSLEYVRPLVVRALRRSNVRKKIVQHLFDIDPNSSYVSDIAYHVKTTPTNVIGALRGMNNRYRQEESLLQLNVVEEMRSGNNVKLYRITDFGKEVFQSLHERR